MDKALKILEDYAQWIALGIGGLFLVFMGYTYFVASPVKVPVGLTPASAKEYEPGEVDAQVKAIAIEPLERAMKETKVPEIPMTDPVATLLAPKLTPQVALAQVVPEKIPGKTGPTTRQSEPSLPAIAAAKPAEKLVGRSLIGLPDPKAPKPAAPADPAAAAVQPVVDLKWQDSDWVTQLFRVSMADLAQSFTAARIPDGVDAMPTRFLAVEAMRQEVLPNGTFGQEEKVTPVPIAGVDRMNLPADTAPQQDLYSYRDWAITNTVSIIQPPFPLQQQGKGVDWVWPGTPANPNVVPGGIVPGGLVPPGALGPRASAARPVTEVYYMAGGVPPGDRLRPPTGGVPIPGAVPGRPAPGVPPIGGGQGFAPAPFPGGGIAPGAPGIVGPGVGGQAASGQVIPGAGLEAGFIPAQASNQDFDIAVHDITVKPGKSYRYKVRYAVQNPLWGQQLIGKPADQKKFAIWSPFSAWGEPVVIPTRVKFWVAKTDVRNKLAPVADFDVFVWTAEKGGWGLNHVVASPGDPVGGSNFMVVDVRGDNRSSYVLIADASGVTTRRDAKTDAVDTEYDEIKKQLNPPTTPGGIAPGIGIPGVIPGAGVGGQGFAPPRGGVPRE